MGFSKRYLPDFDRLVEIREEINDDREFLKFIVGKSDCLMGSTESLQMIRYIEEEIENERKDGI
jgi:hypothetical protein